MNPEAQTPLGCSPMDTQIFKQGLSVLATSAYIIIAALMGDGAKATLAAIASRWNAAPPELEAALAELAVRNIIERHPGFDGGDPVYIVNPASLWGIGA
jgi:hypothetical protein